jgi:hypothetical protein
MNDPDIDAQLAARDAGFFAAAEACLRHWDRALPIEVADSDQVKFRVCFPLVAHSLNQVRAALMLVGANQSFVATANTRVAFEHALTAQWVLLTYGGAERLVRHMEASYLTNAKEFSKAVGDPPELSDIISRLPVDGPARSYSLPMICDRFSQDKLLYNLYRHLGQSIHPSLETLRAYLNVRDRDSREVSAVGARVPPDLYMALGFSAVMAAEVIERLRCGQSKLAVIEEIAKAASLPFDLSFSDTQPHLQHAPE